MDIVKGSKIRITVGDRRLIAIVAQVWNRPPADGKAIDQWQHWDIEYHIQGREGLVDLYRGSYGRWRQYLDGGRIEVLQ